MADGECHTEVTESARKDKSKAKPKVSFSHEETERLITLWQQEEVLFNCKHQDYFKSDPRQNAIQRLLLALDKPGENKQKHLYSKP